jgi:hypothetical protein
MAMRLSHSGGRSDLLRSLLATSPRKHQECHGCVVVTRSGSEARWAATDGGSRILTVEVGLLAGCSDPPPRERELRFVVILLPESLVVTFPPILSPSSRTFAELTLVNREEGSP